MDVDELLEKYKALDNEIIKEKDWKFASYNVPIEVHVELIKLCFECKLWAEFDTLLDPALVRLKFRRYEVPYISVIDVNMSSNKQANIPNGFEKIPVDLNSANLRIELKKLRASAKSGLGGGKKKEEKKKKEEEKKAPPVPKGPPPKKGAPAKGVQAKQAAALEEEDLIDDEDDIQAT